MTHETDNEPQAFPPAELDHVPVIEIDHTDVYLASDGYRFRVIARNGEILASGESYRHKRDALAVAYALTPESGYVQDRTTE